MSINDKLLVAGALANVLADDGKNVVELLDEGQAVRLHGLLSERFGHLSEEDAVAEVVRLFRDIACEVLGEVDEETDGVTDVERSGADVEAGE